MLDIALEAERWRRWRRTKRRIVWVLWATVAALGAWVTVCAVYAQTPAPTTVTGQIGSGPLFLRIVAQEQFTAADGVTVQDSQATDSSSSNGRINVQLEPNEGSTPASSYLVQVISDRKTWTEVWIVPQSGTPVGIANVRASAAAAMTPNYQVPFQQMIAPANCASLGGIPIYNGSAWSCTNVLSNPMSATGDLIVGGAAGVAGRLGAGANGTVLTVVGGSPAWSVPSPGGVSSVFGRTGAVTAQSGDYSFAQIAGQLAAAQLPSSYTAPLASSLAATPTQCSAGEAANGVSANGNAQGCFTPAGGAGMVNPMTAAGDLIVGGSSGAPGRLAAGTSGYVLTSTGPGGAPSWQVATGGAGAGVSSLQVDEGTALTGNVMVATGSGLSSSQLGQTVTMGCNAASPSLAGCLTLAGDLGGSATAPQVMAVEANMANDTTTGTVQNALAKLSGAPSAAVVTAATDTSGAIGVVVGGAGTSGSAEIVTIGAAACAFDAATTAGDYVQLSSTTGGDCHDAGAAWPTSGQVLGRVLSTNAAAGTYTVVLFGPGSQASAGAGGGSSVWSGLTDPTAALSLSMGNDNTTFTWGTATSGNAFTIQDSANDTGGGDLVHIGLGSSSDMDPLRVQGLFNYVLVNNSGNLSVQNGTYFSGNSTVTLADSANNQGGTISTTGTGSGFWLSDINNSSSGGTTLNELARISGGGMATTATTDTTGAIGVVMDGAGTSGSPKVVFHGSALCQFDATAVTEGDWVQISSTVAGNCHDAGASKPASGEIIGIAAASGAASTKQHIYVAINF